MVLPFVLYYHNTAVFSLFYVLSLLFKDHSSTFTQSDLQKKEFISIQEQVPTYRSGTFQLRVGCRGLNILLILYFLDGRMLCRYVVVAESRRILQDRPIVVGTKYLMCRTTHKV
jgi:uncharacterized membrane protein